MNKLWYDISFYANEYIMLDTSGQFVYNLLI